MPLLRKAQFDKFPVPNDLRADEEIFYCSLTGEIFRDYDDFFKRTILLNSLVWTCSATGKSGLTYEEALTSERSVQESLEKLPDYLERPILYIAGLTVRGRLDDLVSDVVNFMKERYFVGEVVEIVHSGVKRFGTIIEVNYDQNASQTSSNRSADQNGSSADGNFLDNAEENVVSSSTQDQSCSSQTPVPPNKKRKSDEFGPQADSFKYVVEVLRKKREEKQRGSSPTDRYSDALKRMAVFTFDGIIRRKVALTKTRCRLFLKNVCELEQNRFFVVKTAIKSAYNLDHIQWENLFAGPKPNFTQTPLTRKPYTRSGSPTASSTTPKASSTKICPQQQQSPASSQQRRINEQEEARLLLAWEKQQQVITVLLAEAQKFDIEANPLIVKAIHAQPGTLVSDDLVNDLREALKKAREDEKERIRDERRKAREQLVEWKKPRDDLECDDHRPLSEFVPIAVPAFLSDDDFGECLKILEFLLSFDEILNLKETFPDGVRLTYIYEALINCDPQGPLTELASLLLREIFRNQAEEDGDEANLENKEELQQENSDLDRRFFRKDIEEATNFSESVRNTHGVSVRFLPVDGYTITEVIRMYFMSGGYYTGVSTARFRFHRRGGFKCWDDHALLFRMKNQEIMLELSKKSFFDLTPGVKLKILSVLCDQLLTFSTLRTPLLQKTERLWQARWEFRQLQVVDQKWDREHAAAKLNLQINEDDEKLSSHLNGDAQPSATFDAIKKCLQKDSKREKLKILLENLNFGLLASAREMDEVRTIQKTFLQTEEIRYKQEIQQLQACCGLTLLGQDRLYRKYWLVTSVQALLIERDDSQELQECEQATPIEKVDLQYVADVANGLELRRILQVCTGVSGDCPVHSTWSKQDLQRWFILYDSQVLDQLLAALNRRGFRENELFENLSFYKEYLNEEIFSKCDSKFFLTGSNIDPTPTTVDADTLSELAFRDSLLDMEEKIKSGGLGNLKVDDRDRWRSAIEDGRYEPESEFVFISEIEKVSLVDVDDGNQLKKMRLALLQVAVGVNARFLKRPFASEKNSISEAGVPFSIVDTFYLWKKSLLTVMSWAQLHLHMETLERAVTWNKSLLQMKCRQCRRKGDGSSMLVCRLCDRPYHAACLKPVLRKLPAAGSWTCVDCQRTTVETNFVPKNTDWKQNSDLYDSESVNFETPRTDPKCSLCKKGLNKKGRLSCVRCSSVFHIACANSENPSKKNWLCNECLSDPPLESDDAEENHSTSSIKISRTGRAVKRPISFEELDFDRKASASSVASPSSSAGGKVFKKNNNFMNGIDDDLPYDEPADSKKVRKARPSFEKQGPFGKFYQLLNLIGRHSDAWPFLKPVSRKDAPDYYAHILKPIDLQTIRNKLDSGKYEDEKKFLQDFRQMFENCRIYNETFCPVFRCGQNLETYFNEKLHQLNFNGSKNGVDTTNGDD